MAQSDTCGVSVTWEGQHDRTEGREVTFQWQRVREQTPLDHGGNLPAVGGIRSETLDRALVKDCMSA